MPDAAPRTNSYRVVHFRPEHGPAFASLNRDWLVSAGLYEPPDEAQLADPQSTILDIGGTIFVALRDGNVVGTAAITPHAPDEAELLKLAVAESERGRGLGRCLLNECIERARAMGTRRLVLVSSTKLGPALRLYESAGFVYHPVPASTLYATADVYMELDLTTSAT